MSSPPAPCRQVAERLLRVDASLAGLRESQHAATVLWAQRAHPHVQLALSQLRHRLSAYIRTAPITANVLDDVAAAEASIYQRWSESLSGALQISDMQRLVAMSPGQDGALRAGPVWICSRDGMTRIPMVAAEQAVARLQKMLQWFASGKLGVGVLCGVRLLALVNNAHAFNDGNGRLGRALLNHCLHARGMPKSCYVPLKAFSLLSQGGYEICLREAELFGRWDPLLTYHCAVVELCARIGSERQANLDGLE